jgi:hypothetical protein
MPPEDATRVQGEQSRTRGMPPVNPPTPPAPITHQQARPTTPTPGPDYSEKPKRGQPNARRDSPLRLPCLSVVLTLWLVAASVVCLVVAIIGLGGRTPPTVAPRFVVLTAPPSPLPEITLPPLGGPTVPAGLNPGGAVPAFVLEGPTLPPVVISPTPESIAVGKNVVVRTQDDDLNVRVNPGLGNEILFRARAGTVFTIIDGPTQTDGLTWWKIQNTADANQTGWAAAAYLIIAPKP